MKKAYFLFVIFCSLLSKAQVVNFNMANSTQTVSCSGTFNFYDSGGPGGSYANNENFTAVFVPATPGQCLKITFSAFATESCCDPLSVYDGSTIAAPLLGTFQGGVIPPVLTSTSGSLTVRFTSDGSVIGTGWAAVISCTTCPAPPAYYLQSAGTQTIACPPTYSVFYDSGGPGGNYANSENSMKTFSAPAGSCLTFNFTGFNTESCCDRLRIYDGPNGGSPLIGTYAGLSGPGSITSSGSTLTFSFTSDGSVIAPGWTANITCGGSCSGAPPAGAAVAAPSSSCASFNTTLSVTGSTVACGLTYQWQSASVVGGPYSNIVGATAANYTSNITSTTFFRRRTICGASSATSAVASASISSPTSSCSLSTYGASAITYSFETFAGTILPTTDDVLFSALSTFGFPFCFAGQQFSGGYVASNSSFVFDAFPCNPNIYAMPGAVNASPGQGTGWSINTAAPTTADNTPRNAILAPWQDTDPGVGGTMRYATLGTTPNRRFIVSWENIPMFSCNAMLFTGQIKLFETSNNIEIHIGNKPLCATWNTGQAIMGLHNFNGTIYRPPVNMTAHNSPTQWTMSNTAYRWTTSCTSASNCAVPLPVEFKSLYGQYIDGVNKLWWETAVEENIKEFIVERSLDAANFSAINLTDAKGEPSLYSINDNTFKRGFVNYYRVTGVLENGNKTLTSVYAIFNTDDKILINSIFPNPANDKLSVTITGKGAENNCTFIVYDQFGRIVLQKEQKINYGTSQADLNIETLEKGIYIIEIKTQDNSVISKQKFSKM